MNNAVKKRLTAANIAIYFIDKRAIILYISYHSLHRSQTCKSVLEFVLSFISYSEDKARDASVKDRHTERRRVAAEIIEPFLSETEAFLTPCVAKRLREHIASSVNYRADKQKPDTAAAFVTAYSKVFNLQLPAAAQDIQVYVVQRKRKATPAAVEAPMTRACGTHVSPRHFVYSYTMKDTGTPRFVCTCFR